MTPRPAQRNQPPRTRSDPPVDSEGLKRQYVLWRRQLAGLLKHHERRTAWRRGGNWPRKDILGHRRVGVWPASLRNNPPRAKLLSPFARESRKCICSPVESLAGSSGRLL